MKLSTCFEITAGHSYRGKIIEVKGSGVKIIQLKNSSKYGVNWSDLTESNPAIKTPNWLQEGDILFAFRSSKYYAFDLGNIQDKGRLLAAQQFFILRVKQNYNVIPKFIAWQLNQAPCQQYFFSKEEGSIHKSINKSILKNANIKIPNLETQNKIINLHNSFVEEETLLKDLKNKNKDIMTVIANKLKDDE